MNMNDKKKYLIDLTPAEYRVTLLKGSDDKVLSRSDALCLRGYGNWNYDNSIKVYSKKELEKPYDFDIVDNFDNIDYSLLFGIPVCSEKQAFIDLMDNPKDELQTLLEALGDYYYTHNESFDSLELNKSQTRKLNKYKEDAIHYWDS